MTPLVRKSEIGRILQLKSEIRSITLDRHVRSTATTHTLGRGTTRVAKMLVASRQAVQSDISDFGFELHRIRPISDFRNCIITVSV